MPNPRTPLALLSLLLLVGCSAPEPTVTVTYKRIELHTVAHCIPNARFSFGSSGAIFSDGSHCVATFTTEPYHTTERMPAATFDLKMKYEPGFADSILSFQ